MLTTIYSEATVERLLISVERKDVLKGKVLSSETLDMFEKPLSLEMLTAETLSIITEGPPESAYASDASGLKPSMS
tara:strand:+ start:1043 stop:1270 length:228 start_codon:yes stop_codon:yes gene_type:complete